MDGNRQKKEGIENNGQNIWSIENFQHSVHTWMESCLIVTRTTSSYIYIYLSIFKSQCVVNNSQFVFFNLFHINAFLKSRVYYSVFGFLSVLNIKIPGCDFYFSVCYYMFLNLKCTILNSRYEFFFSKVLTRTISIVWAFTVRIFMPIR